LTVGRASPIAIGGAGLLAVACVAPLILWGNPYPDGVVQYWVWGLVLTLLVAAAASLIPMPALRDFPGSFARGLTRMPPRRFAALVAIVTTGLGIVFAMYAFGGAASTPDEIAQLWHAKILLHGRMSIPVDPNREFFGLETVVDVERWYSQFPIGGPLMAVPGALLGTPWLVNPLLAGLAVVALYHFARHAYGETQGRAIVALFSATPMVLLMTGTWMNHVPVLLLATCTLAALVEWDRASTARRALAYASVIGLALGAMATIRPLDAVAVATAVGAFQLWTIRRLWLRIRELVLQAVFGVIGVAPLAYANWATTGSVTRFGYDVLWGSGHRVGFHTDPYGTSHTLRRALEFAITYLSELNMYLLGWPAPAMLIVLIGLLAMRKVTRWDALVFGLFGAQVLAYAAYWGEGEFLGPRFLYTALPAIVVLVARTPFLIAERFGPRWRRGAVAFMMSCLLVAWCVPGLPFNVWGFARQAHAARRTLKVDIAGTVRAANVHNALVFLREPFSFRLARRLWGLGITRSEAARLIASRDACSLLSAIRMAEGDGSPRRRLPPAALAQAADLFVPGEQAIRATDSRIQISSAASINPPCQSELQGDLRIGGAAFGPALPLEPIDRDGRIEGDVIYVADLGDRNTVLRSRFGTRTWYRLVVGVAEGGQIRATLIAY